MKIQVIQKKNSQLNYEQKALDYYEKKTGYRPSSVASEIQEDGKLHIQLYDNMGDHNSTSDWYTIDINTGKGEDITGAPVDLN